MHMALKCARLKRILHSLLKNKIGCVPLQLQACTELVSTICLVSWQSGKGTGPSNITIHEAPCVITCIQYNCYKVLSARWGMNCQIRLYSTTCTRTCMPIVYSFPRTETSDEELDFRVKIMILQH